MESTSPETVPTNTSSPKESQTLHRAIADLARAYMEEMRDDAPTTTTQTDDCSKESSPRAEDSAEKKEEESSMAELNIQEILQNVVKTHSLEPTSKTPSVPQSSLQLSESNLSRQSTRSSPEPKMIDESSILSSSPKKKDEILSRFDSIHLTCSHETPISTLDVIEQTSRSSVLLNSLTSRLGIMQTMNWTEGCCISPKSKLEMMEEESTINVDVVRTESMEKSLLEERSSVVSEVEIEVEQEISIEEEGSVVSEEGSVEEESMEESLHEETTVSGVCSKSAETEPVNNLDPVKEAKLEEDSAKQEYVETSSSPQNQVHEANSADTDAVDNTSAFLDFPTEATLIRDSSQEEPYRSISMDDTEGSVTSAEVAAILSSIPDSEEVEDTPLAAATASVSSNKSTASNDEEVRCRTETEESTLSEGLKAILVAIKNESPVASKESEENVEGEEVDAPEGVADSVSEVKETKEREEEVLVDCVEEKTEVTSEEAKSEVVEPVSSTPKSSIQDVPQDDCKETLSPQEEEEVAFPHESVLSPHSEASRMTDIASNQSLAKSVRWSMSLGALSSEGGTREESLSQAQSRSSAASPCPVGESQCSSSPLQDLTSNLLAKLKKDWKYVETSSLVEWRDDIISWTEQGACFRDTTLMSDGKSMEGDIVKNEGMQRTETAGESKIVESSPVKADKESPDSSPSVVSAPAERNSSPMKQFLSQVGINAASMSKSFGHKGAAPKLEVANNNATETVDVSKEQEQRTKQIHEEVFKERDSLREWKFNAEESMKCQEAVTGVLREQKSSLVKQCGDLENTIKELKEWKFDINVELEAKATQIEDLASQKTELIKQCEKHQQSIEELTQLKMTRDDALVAREADLQQMKLEHANLVDLSREQQEAIKNLNEWKAESTEIMKNQLSELESERAKSLDLADRCKHHQESIHQLTSWKSEKEPILESHAEEMRLLKEEKSSLVSKCDDQQISLDKLNRWKMSAEEELKQHLDKLEMAEKRNVEANARCEEQIKANEELAKWKSEAEETVKKQIKLIDELTQSKIEAAAQEQNMNDQLELLREKNAELIGQCDKYKNTIEEFTKSKLDLEKSLSEQLAEIDSLKIELAACPKKEDVKADKEAVKDLTKWKAKAETALKEKKTELNELQSHYLIFGKQCNEQKELIEQQEDKLKSLTKERDDASKKLSLLEKESSKQAKKIKTHEDTIQSKSDEVTELKAEIAQLKEKIEGDGKPDKEEMLAMKMSHHKELMALKTERHMLASKIEKLASKNEDANSQVRELRSEFEQLKSKYEHEKEGHDNSKTAVKKLEKALKVRPRRSP